MHEPLPQKEKKIYKQYDLTLRTLISLVSFDYYYYHHQYVK